MRSATPILLEHRGVRYARCACPLCVVIAYMPWVLLERIDPTRRMVSVT